MSGYPASAATRSIRRLSLLALVTIALLIFGAGGWAALANLSGAIIGAGTIVVDGNVKQVQHKEGGIVGEILVRNGSHVEAGDVLVRLDDTLPRANLGIVLSQIDQLQARRLRLMAERDGSEDIPVFSDTENWPQNAREYLEGEKALFHARRRTIEGQKSQLRERIGQIGKETEGLIVRRDAKSEELDWIEQELSRVRSLSEQGLIQFTRLAELQRLKAQLEGERGQFITEIARTATRITETELQILQLDEDRRTEVLTELRDVDNKLAELAEQRIAAEDQLSRIAILSPQAGIVHELAVHTIGGVIPPGETIMQIVPTHDALVVEARIQPADIDQLHVGQRAVLRFSAFNQRTTPEIGGTVAAVAADLIHNPQTGEAWYTARI
ncbi:HlyD family type I secretion periplasmic adaptor subunit, partial [Neorhizobium sp. DT-125]|uniref:HlyD family type I secretion periplasmic adaptor subunit n=1 Tax=Neorhizobium sp. DT-125 TaxID=3396163 RepID=UPI003F1BC163